MEALTAMGLDGSRVARDDAGPDFIEALARGLEVLRSFRPGRRVATLSEIAADTGLARPTVRRILKTLEGFGIKPRGSNPTGPLVSYVSMRMENRGGAPEGTPELYFTDPDGLLMQLQDVRYCGGAGVLGEVCV